MKVEAELGPQDKESRRAAALNVTPKRALVVDDEPAMCVLIQAVLGSADIEAVILGNGAEADDYFQEKKFDVILVGLCGPGGDGIELVRKIRSTGFNRRTPIIVISDDQRPGALRQGFEAGASFFVYKPIDKAHLMRLIRVTQGTIEQEKRRFRRVPVQAKVRLKCGQTEIVGETIDLSLNGALMTAPDMLPLGSLVEVSLYVLHDMGPIVGLGSVVRILNNNRMGILLDQLPVAESARLQEYLLPIIAE